MYYVYALIDPRNNQPFYIGKGKGNRARSHLMENKRAKIGNLAKRHKIEHIKSLGLEVGVVYLHKNIMNEREAYDLETSEIQRYGRKGYEDNGILTNVCIDSRPPNHKGRKNPKQVQKNIDSKWALGYKHTEESLENFSKRSKGEANVKFSGLTEEDMLDVGKRFSKYFDGKISQSKWKWYIPNIEPELKIEPLAFLKTFRFGYRNLLDVFVDKIGCEKERDIISWFHNPETMEQIRPPLWKLDRGIVTIPEGFVQGRGKVRK